MWPARILAFGSAATRGGYEEDNLAYAAFDAPHNRERRRNSGYSNRVAQSDRQRVELSVPDSELVQHESPTLARRRSRRQGIRFTKHSHGKAEGRAGICCNGACNTINFVAYGSVSRKS
jgi:hypothetical protein